MKLFLKFLFSGIFVFMIAMTIRTGLSASIWKSWPGFQANPWAIATLYDAYFGFLTFYVWVCWKERTLGARVLWFLLIMSLGNIAMSFYVLLQLFGLKAGERAESILMRRPA